MISGTDTKELVHEAAMLAQIHHPRFVRLFGISRKQTILYVVMEFVVRVGAFPGWPRTGRQPLPIPLPPSLHPPDGLLACSRTF